jgi:hypothetical protein
LKKSCTARVGTAHSHSPYSLFPVFFVELSGAQKAPPEKKKKKRGIHPWVQRICSEPEWDESMEHDASKLIPGEPDWPTEPK